MQRVLDFVIAAVILLIPDLAVVRALSAKAEPKIPGRVQGTY